MRINVALRQMCDTIWNDLDLLIRFQASQLNEPYDRMSKMRSLPYRPIDVAKNFEPLRAATGDSRRARIKNGPRVLADGLIERKLRRVYSYDT